MRPVWAAKDDPGEITHRRPHSETGLGRAVADATHFVMKTIEATTSLSCGEGAFSRQHMFVRWSSEQNAQSKAGAVRAIPLEDGHSY